MHLLILQSEKGSNISYDRVKKRQKSKRFYHSNNEVHFCAIGLVASSALSHKPRFKPKNVYETLWTVLIKPGRCPQWTRKPAWTDPEKLRQPVIVERGWPCPTAVSAPPFLAREVTECGGRIPRMFRPAGRISSAGFLVAPILRVVYSFLIRITEVKREAILNVKVDFTEIIFQNSF